MTMFWAAVDCDIVARSNGRRDTRLTHEGFGSGDVLSMDQAGFKIKPPGHIRRSRQLKAAFANRVRKRHRGLAPGIPPFRSRSRPNKLRRDEIEQGSAMPVVRRNSGEFACEQ